MIYCVLHLITLIFFPRSLLNSSVMSSYDNYFVISCSAVNNARLSSLSLDKHDLKYFFYSL